MRRSKTPWWLLLVMLAVCVPLAFAFDDDDDGDDDDDDGGPPGGGGPGGPIVQPEMMAASLSAVPRCSDEGSGTNLQVTQISTGGIVTTYTLMQDDMTGDYTLANKQTFRPGQDGGSSCMGDVNGDGLVNGDDLAIVVDNLGCQATCVGDVNGDGQTNGADVSTVLGNLGCSGANCVGDVNGDGTVNQDDLTIVQDDLGCQTG